MQASSLNAYVLLSLMGGLRTEECRALRWNEVDLAAGTINVYRLVRIGDDTKTAQSRRTLQLPVMVIQALKDLGPQDDGLVFCTAEGKPLSAAHVRREFRKVTAKAGLGKDWTPRELRHSFVLLLDDAGVSMQAIADVVGHSSTCVTSAVYLHSLTPVLQQGAIAMDAIFKPQGG
jgi:integrase